MIDVAGAHGVLASDGPLKQRALLNFVTLQQPPTPPDVRFYAVAPAKRPGVEAPLGWTLSDATRADLDNQLKDLVDAQCDPPTASYIQSSTLACMQKRLATP